MNKLFTLATFLILGSIISVAAQNPTPKPASNPRIYKRIEIKNGDTIVNITKNYDQLTPQEKKELDNIDVQGLPGERHMRMKVQKLDSAEIAKLKKEGKWVEGADKNVMYFHGDGAYSDSVFEKRIFTKHINIDGDSTKKQIVIVTTGDGPEGEDIVLHRFPGGIDKDVMIETVPGELPGKKMFIRKHFNEKFTINFTLESKTAPKVVVKDETGKVVFTDEPKSFNGSYNKEIQLGMGSYEVVVTQGGKEKLKYKIER